MSTPADWARAYARQADADFNTWEVLHGDSAVPQCHGLLFLQMACEKLCKSHLIAEGVPSDTVQASHGYIAKPLPVVIKRQIAILRPRGKSTEDLLKSVRHLAGEIEVLNPSMDRNGQRPDNCEYPWEDHSGTVHSPLDWTFHPSHLLAVPRGRTFLKLLRAAIDRLLE